jgi:hypothetical protein
LSAAFLAAITVGMAGCGPSGGAAGVVSGKVTYNGTPLTGGTITLHPAKGGPDIPISITNEGTFTSSGVPDGEMQVSIETESLKNKHVQYDTSKMRPGVKPPGDIQLPDVDMSKQPTYMKIPPKYASVKSSGLTWTITKGDNKQDFNLTDN